MCYNIHMENQKKKNKIAYIIMGLVLGLSFVGAWIWYICTLPDMYTQLQYSPFYLDGVWRCSDEGVDFEIISDEGEGVTGIITTGEKVYEVQLSYASTRGFSHRYAAIISMNSIDSMDNESYISFSFGGYNFEEENFSLESLRFTNANKVVELFNEKIDLHFDKIS